GRGEVGAHSAGGAAELVADVGEGVVGVGAQRGDGRDAHHDDERQHHRVLHRRGPPSYFRKPATAWLNSRVGNRGGIRAGRWKPVAEAKTRTGTAGRPAARAASQRRWPLMMTSSPVMRRGSRMPGRRRSGAREAGPPGVVLPALGQRNDDRYTRPARE